MSGYTVDGSFQQYCIAKAAIVARIPKECALDAVSPILCAGITVYKALKESGARPGQFVAIPGAGGGLGTLAIQYAKAMGLRPIAIDTGAEKASICAKLGAEKFFDFATTKTLVEDINAYTDGGVHAVVVLAVAEKPFQQATEYTRSRGTVVIVGLPADAYIKAPVFLTVVRMISIKGSYVGNRADTQEAIDFFRRGLINAPYKVRGLSELPAVFEEMEKGKKLNWVSPAASANFHSLRSNRWPNCIGYFLLGVYEFFSSFLSFILLLEYTTSRNLVRCVVVKLEAHFS
jgi:propanol-preferring alcohol dehydrogenase